MSALAAAAEEASAARQDDGGMGMGMGAGAGTGDGSGAAPRQDTGSAELGRKSKKAKRKSTGVEGLDVAKGKRKAVTMDQEVESGFGSDLASGGLLGGGEEVLVLSYRMLKRAVPLKSWRDYPPHPSRSYYSSLSLCCGTIRYDTIRYDMVRCDMT